MTEINIELVEDLIIEGQNDRNKSITRKRFAVTCVRENFII